MPIHTASFRINDRFKRPVVRLAVLAITGWLLVGCATAPEPKSAARIPLQSTGCGLEENDRGLPSLAPLMRRVTPAVVTVSAESSIQTEPPPFLKDPDFKRFLDQMGLPLPDWDPSERRQSVGSGVIVDARRGYVMTNEHLLKDANTITVTLTDRRSFRARRLASDPSTDVAILKIPPVDVIPLPFGDSNRLEVGDFVIAIGNPFGLGQTVTLGIVSAVGRSDIAGNQLGELIQTDASINPGNSGGPLIDLTGAVVGINTALIGPTGGNVGIGFAVPSNRAQTALKRVRK